MATRAEKNRKSSTDDSTFTFEIDGLQFKTFFKSVCIYVYVCMCVFMFVFAYLRNYKSDLSNSFIVQLREYCKFHQNRSTSFLDNVILILNYV